MKTTIGLDQNEVLADPLMEILGRLRQYPSRVFVAGFGEALSRHAERFVARLSGHRRQAEDDLFPALRALEPGSACDLESLERDHRTLDVRSRDLALQIGDMAREEAYGATRSVLAALLDHLQREAEDVDQFVRSLDVLDSRRLSVALRGTSGRETGESVDPRGTN